MPVPVIPTAPNALELSDFTGGWQPDVERAAAPANALLQAMNLVPDTSGTLRTRAGFKRLLAPLAKGYSIESLHPYRRTSGDTTGNYLMAVLSNGKATADNVQVFAVDLGTLTASRVDTPGRIWNDPDAHHWGEGISQTYYGGGLGDLMYSWNPDDGWDASPSVPKYPTLLASWSSGVNIGTDEQQNVEVKGTGGTFKLRFRRNHSQAFANTASIALDANANTVQAALEALANIGTGNVTVARTGIAGDYTYNVRFMGKLQRRDWPLMKAVDNLSGAGHGVTITEAVPGVRKLAPNHAFGYDRIEKAEGQRVLYDADQESYQVAKGSDKAKGDIRFSPWEQGADYNQNDYVSRYAVWGTNSNDAAGNNGENVSYWRSFKARADHTSTASDDPAKLDATSKAKWKAVKLTLPVGDDGGTTADWNPVPVAAQTNVAAWWGDRLWMRYDDQGPGGKRVVQFSAPLKPKHHTKIGEFAWDPTDWAPGNTLEGVGGGWIPIRSPDNVTALYAYGDTLLIFSRHTSWALTGYSEDSFNLRPLANYGAIGPRSACEHNGLVYFASDQGFFVTDGSEARMVPGFENLTDWWNERLDWENSKSNVTVFSFGQYVWIAVPSGNSGVPDRTIIYDPGVPRMSQFGSLMRSEQGFWPLDLAIAAECVARLNGIDQLFFSIPAKKGNDADVTYGWDGANQVSSSTYGVTKRNLFLDPGFNPRRLIPNPSGTDDYDRLHGARAKNVWRETKPSKVRFVVTSEAARRGVAGAKVTNKRHPPASGDWVLDADRLRVPPSPGYAAGAGAAVQVRYEGIGQSFVDLSAQTHHVGIFVRRPDWGKRKRVDWRHVRMFVGAAAETEALDATGRDDEDAEQGTVALNGDAAILAKANHHYEYQGKGWWRVWATYTGSISARYHGFVIAPGLTIHADSAFCDQGATPNDYGDGDGGDSGSGGFGGWGTVHQYDHPDVQALPMDDDNSQNGAALPIRWHARLPWFAFGVKHRESRSRRMWALVRGSIAVVLRGYINWMEQEVFDIEQVPLDQSPDAVTYFEGKVTADASAVSYKVEGLGAPASFLGVAADFELRREARYGVNRPFTQGG